ncbi:mRNA-capping enzyme, partial [Plakobranchus ocellatus]
MESVMELQRAMDALNMNTVQKSNFMEGVSGVVEVTSQPLLGQIQRQCHELIGWTSRKPGFPGSQPVSMKRSDLQKLKQMPYKVSWKADGCSLVYCSTIATHGILHQGAPVFTNRGRQCISNSVAALVYHLNKSISTWETYDLDHILDQGDNLHSILFGHLYEDYLLVNSLPKQLTSGVVPSKFEESSDSDVPLASIQKQGKGLDQVFSQSGSDDLPLVDIQRQSYVRRKMRRKVLATSWASNSDKSDWNSDKDPDYVPEDDQPSDDDWMPTEKMRTPWNSLQNAMPWYLMVIDGPDRVFMLDRDFRVFCIPGLNFFKRRSLNSCLTNTLLDGEFVIDKVDGQNFPKYLVYDIIKFEGQHVGNWNFDDRLYCIEKEIIEPRLTKMKQGTLNKSIEPFSVYSKPFCHIKKAQD